MADAVHSWRSTPAPAAAAPSCSIATGTRWRWASASSRIRELPGAPGLAGLRDRRELAAHLRVHPRGPRATPVGGRRTSRRVEQHEHARGDGPLRRAGREIWACPNVDSRAGDEATSSSSSAAPHDGSTTRAATGSRSPRRPASSGSRAPARRLRRDRPHRHAQRLGPDPALRRVRHRPSLGFELGPVRPANADWSPECSSSSACPARRFPRSSSRARSSAG